MTESHGDLSSDKKRPRTGEFLPKLKSLRSNSRSQRKDSALAWNMRTSSTYSVGLSTWAAWIQYDSVIYICRFLSIGCQHQTRGSCKCTALESQSHSQLPFHWESKFWRACFSYDVSSSLHTVQGERGHRQSTCRVSNCHDDAESKLMVLYMKRRGKALHASPKLISRDDDTCWHTRMEYGIL